MWLFALADNRPVTVELRPRELAAAVAVMPWVAPRLAELLDRDLATEPASTGARTALLRTLERTAQPGR